ncbi:MAG: BspA family leucine-rich repeat surface protein, partial [Paludibacteraceae bacterium]|nr:BspA family leucine-rich repeat surface protein [Paludibacteraceae bacterium]
MREITLFLTMLLTLLSAQTTQAAQPKIYTMFDPEFGELTYYYNINYAENVSTPYIELYDPVGNPHAVRFTSYYNKVVKVVIDPSMKDAPLTSMFYMFFGGYNSKTEQSQNLSSLRKIQGLENLNTAGVTDMSYVFYRCSSLESLDLSSFNTSNVETMKFMFGGCYALKSVDVSSFSTPKVKDISSMFHSCRRIETLDLTSFITTSVTDMRAAFQGCSALTTIWCDDDWSGTSAQSSYLFSGCSNLVGGQGTTFNREIIDATYARPDGGEEEPGYFTIKGGVYPIKRKVYTEFVEETGTMTYYYDELRDSRPGVTELYDPIKYPEAVRFASYYDKVTKVVIDPSMKQAPLTSFRNMSYGGMDSETFTMYVLSNVTSIEGLENLNTEIVTDMNSMFIMYTKLETLDLSSFNTSNVTNMNGMFLGCNKLQTLDLTSFDVSNVEDMRMMFGSCYELTTIYCEQDWSEIVPPNNELEDMDNMYVMFSGCKKLVGGRG